MPFAMKQDEPARPLDILTLHPYAIVPQTKTLTKSIQSLGGEVDPISDIEIKNEWNQGDETYGFVLCTF
jgi:hypothetical protein